MADRRLYNVADACAYLGGISGAALRAMVARGELVPVRPPSVRTPGENGRRLLFVREDLDALVDVWRGRSSSEPDAGLSAAALKGWASTPERGRR